MSKRILVVLLVASISMVWGSDALAFNRINGILVKHSSPLSVEVSVSGLSQFGVTTVSLEAFFSYLCLNPQGRPTAEFVQDVSAIQSQFVQPDTNGQALVVFFFDVSQQTLCQQKNYIKVGGSELFFGGVITTALKTCNGKEPGPDNINDGDSCFEFGGTVETTKIIEVLQSDCDPGIRDPDGSVPSQIISCETEAVAHQGGGKGK